MKNAIVHIIKDPEGGSQLDTRLSFRPFIDFLKERRQHEKTQKVRYFDFLIHHFEERLQGKDLLEPEEMQNYADLMELVYSCIFPAIADERDNAWALSIPMRPSIVYGTDTFYALLLDSITGEVRASMIDKEDRERRKLNVQLVFSVILSKLYGIAFSGGDSLIRSFTNEHTGLPSFYRLNIDTRFVDVVSKGPLPVVDWKQFPSHRPVPEIITWLMENLPMANFQFQGITAVTVTEVTTAYVINNIKSLILDPARCENGTVNDEVMRCLQILSGTKDVDFGVMPFLKINGQPVFSGESCHHSIVGAAAENEPEQEANYLEMVESYIQEPRMILYETLPDYQEGELFFLGSLRRVGIRGYGLMPVFYNNRLAGVLEIASHTAGMPDAALLSRLDVIIPLLAQLLQRASDEFDDRMNAIIKENFTSLQPAVEWKFNEAAWQFEQQRRMGESPSVGTIYFKDVYPLYGAIDIRNSTIGRNGALRRDLQTHFAILTETLEALYAVVKLELLEEMIYHCHQWQRALEGGMTTADEINLHTFIAEEAGAFLEHFGRSRPDLAPLMESYRKAIDPEEGIAFQSRRELENSIQLINQTINQHLEEATEELQRTYPCYFEKFRTDGVEYDIYTGQSIAPDKPFDVLYLQNLRLWQLNSMATIARLTSALFPQIPDPLVTTQLIFVHTMSIDISFRKDERRFDVEGGYNIRYQVVKKRIDKVHVQDTNERLTQPGTIAIIYFNDKEAEEYAGYIKYLQEKQLLKQEVEYLELEELQGVSGLRALRVGVKMAMVLLFLVFSVLGGCQDKPSRTIAQAAAPAVPGPHGYKLAEPKKFVMPESLREISGITFLRHDPDTLYAIEDETGKLFYFHPGGGKFPYHKFGKHGDYEDVTVLGDKEFVILRSDGSLFVVPVEAMYDAKASKDGGEKLSKSVRAYEHILPAGEYEGLYGDEGGQLIALCKNCADDDQEKEVSGYILQYGANGSLAITQHFKVEVPADKLTSIHKTVKFHPSCLARHPLTHEWYIISSVNKALLVLDDQWKLKNIYSLNPVLFKQPEGLAFDKQGNMYISNEGGQGNANVLVFAYQP
jgi:hypothetical protein